jgi:hypothetical protein
MKAARIATLVVASLLLSTEVSAQTKNIQLDLAGGQVSIRADTPLDELTAATTLTVECRSGVDCRKVQLRGMEGAATIQSQEEISGSKIELARATRTYSLRDAGRSIELLYDGKEIGKAAVAARGAQPPSSTPVTCAPSAQDIGETYDRRANRATFWVSHLGNIWAHPSDQIDENDQVEIVVLAPEDLLPKLRVKRTSATRVVGGFNIIGEDLFRQAAESRSPRCGELRVMLNDFAPGTGQVQISMLVGDKDVPTGTFEFPVAALYDGYLSYAALYTDTTARTFKLGPSPAGTIILPGESVAHGDREIRYAVFYTHYVWGRREVVKGPEEWYHRVNPTFGVTTSELAEHFLYGVSVDFGGFTVGGGLHSARQTILHPDSGLQVGGPFTGTVDTIPTAKNWTSKGYFSLGVDLRAVVAMFKAAAGVGKFRQ